MFVGASKRDTSPVQTPDDTESDDGDEAYYAYMRHAQASHDSSAAARYFPNSINSHPTKNGNSPRKEKPSKESK